MAGNLSYISNGSDLEGCEMVESKFKIHTFSDTLLDQTVHFQVLRMKDSLYIWIGSSPELSSLAVAMCTRYDSVPSVANLLGSKADLNSSTLAQRLAKKTKKQCFVSYNVPTENMLLSLVEQRINQEIKDRPHNF
ncbi:proteasome assembly chaperone 4-like [Acropora millepora]|uniref:proteasome assembly chaperone 4-like n=1 Tax=Acropora millepora TaxID=45264 RepID=UPI001CF105FA|nr:proteasome assembly chaperone 4-like [Acropora millepora]